MKFLVLAGLLVLAGCGTVGPNGGTAASGMNQTGVSTGAGGAGAMGNEPAPAPTGSGGGSSNPQ